MKNVLTIVAVSFLSSFVLVLFYFYFRPTNLETHLPHGFNEVLERNYDGPLYVVIAKVGYEPKGLKEINFNGLKPDYYPSHFPLYPLLIRLSALITHDYFRSMIALNWIFSAASAIVFYLILKEKGVAKPVWISIIYLFLPPRWLAVRSVGASEGVFIFLLMTLALLLLKKRFLAVSIVGALLILARPPGILFFPPLLILAIVSRWPKKHILSLFSMPAALLALFGYYATKFGDPLIFIHNSSGTNSLLKLLPFGNLLGYVGPIPEGLIYLYVVYAIGLYLLWQQKEKLFFALSSLYFLSTLFIKVDDAWRELIPISGFVLIYAYRKLYLHKYFPVLFIGILLMIYIYTTDLLPKRIFHYVDYAKLRILTVNPQSR